MTAVKVKSQPVGLQQRRDAIQDLGANRQHQLYDTSRADRPSSSPPVIPKCRQCPHPDLFARFARVSALSSQAACDFSLTVKQGRVRAVGEAVHPAPVVFETVRKLIACRSPALACHLYTCPQCQRVEVVPHSCKSRFCPTCGKHATDRWAVGDPFPAVTAVSKWRYCASAQ